MKKLLQELTHQLRRTNTLTYESIRDVRLDIGQPQMTTICDPPPESLPAEGQISPPVPLPIIPKLPNAKDDVPNLEDIGSSEHIERPELATSNMSVRKPFTNSVLEEVGPPADVTAVSPPLLSE